MTENAAFILVLPILLLCSAIASGSETALFRLTHRERADLRRESPGVAAATDALLAQPRRLLLLILIVNMVVNLGYFVVSSILTTRAEGPVAAAAVGAGSVLAIVLVGEILAKVLAGAGRRRFCVVFARPMLALATVSGPLVAAVDRFALSPLVRLVRPAGERADTVEADELRGLVESGREAGVIDETEHRILAEVIELGRLRVREAMLPRDRLVWIDAGADRDAITALAARTRETMLLVCRDGLDGEPVGFLHVKSFLADGAGADGPGMAERCERALVVPEQARLDLVLDRMRGHGSARALCVDERGSIVGLIRASDIVDELLAGMGEEHTDEKHAIHLVGLGTWSVRASLSAREWAQSFRIDEREIAEALARSATIGGVVLERLGRLAEAGDEVTIGRARLRVERVEGRRIEELLVVLSEDDATGDGPPGSGDGPGGDA
jgi:putative hemolysin